MVEWKPGVIPARSMDETGDATGERNSLSTHRVRLRLGIPACLFFLWSGFGESFAQAAERVPVSLLQPPQPDSPVARGAVNTCTPLEVVLNSFHQSGGCSPTLRPQAVTGQPAPLVVTARRRVNPNAPLVPNADGLPALVAVAPWGTGAATLNCTGAAFLSGVGADRDEELTFTFDVPTPPYGITIELTLSSQPNDVHNLFLAAGGANAFDYVIAHNEFRSLMVPTGPKQFSLNLGQLNSLPPGLLIGAIRIRETAGHIAVNRVFVPGHCDDGNECTEDRCELGQCIYQPLPEGSACGSGVQTDCTLPDSCDGLGECRTHHQPDGTACFDGPACTAFEVCVAGRCGPDGCADFTGACGTSVWSCGDNWDLNGIYPDNGDRTFSVTLDGLDDVLLDVDVTIDALQILQNALLRLTQANPPGNLTIATPAGLLLTGSLWLSNDRILSIPFGPLFIADGGRLQLEPVRAPDGGSVSSAGVTVAAGGTLLLSGSMQLVVSGNLILEGTGADACSGGGRGGIVPPPKFDSSGTAEADVLENFVMNGSVQFFHGSSTDFDLGGSLVNRATTPQCFDWSAGGLRLIVSVPPPLGGHTFEVGGVDVGPSAEGFDFAGHTNFSIGTLTVAQNRSVTIQNGFANIAGAGACAEALYVRHLVLRAGSAILLNNARVYYETLTQEPGAAVQTIGCGALVEIPHCVTNEDCADGNVCTDDRCDLTSGSCTHSPIAFLAFGDADRSGAVEVGDVLCAIMAYAGNFAICPKERTDIMPCGAPDGLVEVGDILAFVAAYAGNPPCPDLCP